MGFTSYSRLFHSFGEVTITSESLQILIYARHSWPLSNEGSLTSHNFRNTGQPFIMVIIENLLPSSQCLFLRLKSFTVGIRTTTCKRTLQPTKLSTTSFKYITVRPWDHEIIFNSFSLLSFWDNNEFLKLKWYKTTVKHQCNKLHNYSERRLNWISRKYKLTSLNT